MFKISATETAESSDVSTTEQNTRVEHKYATEKVSEPNKPPLILKLKKKMNKWEVVTEPTEPQTRIWTSASGLNTDIESSKLKKDYYLV